MYKKTEDAILFSVLKNLLHKITNTKTFIDIESRYQVLLVVVFPAHTTPAQSKNDQTNNNV